MRRPVPFVAAAPLTLLLPLLLVHLLTRRDVPRRWALWLLVPVAGLIGFELWTHELYGQGLIAISATYAADLRQQIDASLLERSLSALSFAGGSLVPLLFFDLRLLLFRTFLFCCFLRLWLESFWFR